jgi:hypothetical protein
LGLIPFSTKTVTTIKNFRAGYKRKSKPEGSQLKIFEN